MYTTFIMAHCSALSFVSNIATLMAACASILTEADIPGTSLHGQKPSELKNEELMFWLQRRDHPWKGLKTKEELVRW